jgi:thioredoxin-related protein
MYDDYKAKGFTIVTINSDDDKATIEKYFAENNFTLPAVMGVNTTVADDYKVEAYPTNILLDKHGKVIARLIGFEEAKLRTEIEKLIAAP